MKKLNFKTLEIEDIKGEKVDFGEATICRELGNLLYLHSQDAGIAELGRKIYNGEEVEFRSTDLPHIKELINSDKLLYIPLVKRELISFIEG